MRWPWTPRPPSPKLNEAFARLRDAEDRLDWLEGMVRKLRSKLANLGQRPEKSLEDAAGVTNGEPVDPQYPPPKRVQPTAFLSRRFR